MSGRFWSIQFSGYLVGNVIKCVCSYSSLRKFTRVSLSSQAFVSVLAYRFAHQ